MRILREQRRLEENRVDRKDQRRKKRIEKIEETREERSEQRKCVAHVNVGWIRSIGQIRDI